MLTLLKLHLKLQLRWRLKKVWLKHHQCYLEPIMKVEVDTPDEYMGDVMGDFNSRRGRILGMETRMAAQIILAEVPLGEMFGYATILAFYD